MKKKIIIDVIAVIIILSVMANFDKIILLIKNNL
jgi:hypothetical protein